MEEGEVQIPMDVYFEVRNTIRVSLGRRKANVRIPIYLRDSRRKSEIAKAKDWLRSKIKESPEIQSRFTPRTYKSGDELQIGDRNFSLEIKYRQAKTISGKIVDNRLHLNLSTNTPPLKIRQLISRLIARVYLPEITQKVHSINNRYFRKSIKSIRLKYNQSNWGSCSSSGNINLSTRLLFAPEDVIDYVIVHELAHLTEMNHSPKFYAIVRSIIPDFKKKEKWLKSNGHLCDF